MIQFYYYIENKPLETNGIKPKRKVMTLFGIGSLMTFGLKTVHYIYIS